MTNQHLESLSADADLVFTRELEEIVMSCSSNKLLFTCEPEIYLEKLPDSDDISGAYWAAFEEETLLDAYSYLGALGANVGLTYTYATSRGLLARLGFESKYKHTNIAMVKAAKNEYLKYTVAWLNGFNEIEDLKEQISLLDKWGSMAYLLDLACDGDTHEIAVVEICEMLKQLRQVTDKVIIVNIGMDQATISKDKIQYRLDLKEIIGSADKISIGIDGASPRELLDNISLFERIQKSVNRNFLFTLKDENNALDPTNLEFIECINRGVKLLRLDRSLGVDEQIQLANLYLD